MSRKNKTPKDKRSFVELNVLEEIEKESNKNFESKTTSAPTQKVLTRKEKRKLELIAARELKKIKKKHSKN